MSESKEFVIENPTLHDARAIHNLIGSHAKEDILLPRSWPDIQQSIFQYVIARDIDDGRLVGCASLKPYGNDYMSSDPTMYAEITSLAAETGYEGIKERLVLRCLDRARDIRADKVFTLSTPKRVPMFRFYGFHEADITDLKQVMYNECFACSYFQGDTVKCTFEVPMIIDIRI